MSSRGERRAKAEEVHNSKVEDVICELLDKRDGLAGRSDDWARGATFGFVESIAALRAAVAAPVDAQKGAVGGG